MKCPNCNREIDNDSVFCEYCGTRIKKSKKGLWITLSVIFIAVIAMLVVNTYQINQYESRSGYVDLGLPSGTLWKKVDEGADRTNFGQAYYTYDEAVTNFGSKIPTKAQWEELKDYCTWSWIGDGYKVTGPSGNSITLPAAGFRGCDGEIYGVGTYGYYWSSTPYDSDGAWCLRFFSSEVNMYSYYRCCGQSVRLVQNPYFLN